MSKAKSEARSQAVKHIAGDDAMKKGNIFWTTIENRKRWSKFRTKCQWI